MRNTALIVFVLSAFALAGNLMAATAQAQQFSADLVTVGAAGAPASAPGKIYVADEKVRIETPEFPNSFLLIDGTAPTAYLVRPQSRVFMDAKQSTRLTRLFVSVAPDDPCPRWRTMAEVAGIAEPIESWHCEAGDKETIAGRDTVKFDATSPRGRGSAWIDRQLKFPVKIETEDGVVFLLENIKEGPQPADMFDIPVGYRKFDPRQLLEWLKHSDIWVEPTH